GLLESETAARQSSWTASGRVQGDLFYLRLKAFDPDRFLTWLLPKLRFCFTSAFLLCSTGFILFALGLTLLNGDQIQRDATQLYRMETFLLIWLTIFGAAILHELAHGLTCKRFGGEVHELGFMLLYFQPAFYCNVSDAWIFPRKPHRLWVTFAGAYCELCIWAMAALIWRLTEPGNWVHAVALVILGISGIRSFFDLNPLIKMDGYYLLSDALEIPNLRARSFRYLKAVVAHALFPGSGWAAQAVQGARPRERRIYLTYSLLAGLFSAWVLGSIAWWVGSSLVQSYQGTGFLLFIGLLVAIFRRPLGRSLGTAKGWLRTAPARIASMKWKRPVKSALLLAAIVAVLFLGRKRAKLRMLKVGPRPEEIEVARTVLVTAKTRQEQARKRYDEAIRLRGERQAQAEATVDKSKDRLKYAQQNFERLKPLYEKGFIARKELDEVEEPVTVRGREAEEAQASLNQVLYDDLADFQKELAVTEKELDEAQGRLSVLLAGSRKEEIEATEAEIGRLTAQQRLLEEQLLLMRVVSPHAGVITTPRMKEKVGQLVSKGTLIAEVHDLRTIEAEIAVPEQEIADVQVGQPVVLKARSYPTESFEGTVTAIAPAAVRPDEALDQKKIIRVITKIDNAPLLLKSQMTGNAKVYSGKRSIAELMTRRLVRYLRVEFWSWW
ncbi:MAG: HlyD family efflux transporter periplasmic adaptor subunit, partial [Nitrospirae bacterium]